MGIIKGRWSCSLCKASKRYFEEKEDFEYHLRTHCHVCDEAFTSAKIWDIHHQKAHFGEHSHFLTSINRSGQKQSYYCCNCGKMFVTNLAFEAHMEKYKVYQCLGCPKKLSDFISWCGHSNLCQESWIKMHSLKIDRECFGCSEKFESLLHCQRHYKTCNFAIERDLMLSKLPRGEVLDGIVRGLSALEGIRKNKKSNTFNIKVPFGFLNSNGHKATLSVNGTNNNEPEAEEATANLNHNKTVAKSNLPDKLDTLPDRGSDGASSKCQLKVPTPEKLVKAFKSTSLSLATGTTPIKVVVHKRANSAMAKDLNAEGSEVSSKKIKIYPRQSETLSLTTEKTIGFKTIPVEHQEISDINQPPCPDRNCNIAIPQSQKNQSSSKSRRVRSRGPNDEITIDDFDEKFLESMLNQRPKVFKKFLLKNRTQLLPLMGFSKISDNSWSTQRKKTKENETEQAQQCETSLQPSAETRNESQLLTSLPVDQSSSSLSEDITIKDEPIDTENLSISRNLLKDTTNDPLVFSVKRELVLKLSPLKLSQDHVKVTPVSIPNEWIPLDMEDFEMLDCQPNVDTPTVHSKTVIRPSLQKNKADDEHSKIYGWQHDSWMNGPVSNSVAITVENGDDGQTSVSWCKMTC